MSDSVELRPGMRVMVPSPEGSLAGYFSSAVRRLDDRGLLIDIPTQDGQDLMLQAGQSVTMFVQIHGRMYRFESHVREAGLQVLLDEPIEAKRTERRAFYRLLLTIPAEVTVRHTDGAAQYSEEVWIVDLSGGGVLIRGATELQVSTELELEFLLDDDPPLRLSASVVRSSETDTARSGPRYESNCMFTDLSKADENRIVKFVFEKQREFSQRGVA